MTKLHIHSMPTDQFEDRDPEVTIDTVIIHSMYNPDVEDKYSAESCKAILERFGVSTHYLIDPQGAVYCLVDENKKAWHAGVSCMPDPADGREGVNAFSIGIELIGTEDEDFPAVQYDSLIELVVAIFSRHQIKNIYGHSDIAPERKSDPWCFDWQRFQQGLRERISLEGVMFPDAANR